MAVPTWVAAGAKTEKPSDVGSTSTVAAPAGHATGDLLVIAAHANANHTVATPGGWAVLGSKTGWGTSSQFNTYLFWKLAASSSEPSVTLTTNAASYCDSQMYAFRGVYAAGPIDTGAVFGTVVTSAAVPTPALTTTGTDRLLVFVGFDVTSRAWNTPPAGATERVETSVYIGRFVVATEPKTTAGTEATDNYVRSGGTSGEFACIAGFAVASTPVAVTPVADFTGTPLTGTAPLSVAFTDTSTNTPTSWAWTFGDGGTSTVKNPSHSYSAAGTFTVALVATNTAGSNTKTRTAYVAVASASIPGVSIAFADPWDEPDPTWTRLDTLAGCRVRGWTVDRGRPNEFAKTGTGTATVRIADLDGLFDPTNATSPYYPNVLPGRQAAISLYNPVSSTWHIRFRGFVEAWRYVLSQTREHMELQLDLVDGFAMLARAELRPGVDGDIPGPPPYTSPPYPTLAEAERQEALAGLVKEGNVLYGETAGPVGRDRIQAVLGDIGWPYEWHVGDADPDPDIFSGNVRVGPKVYGPGTSALDAIWDAADADFPGVANVYCSADGHITFHGRQARFRPTVAQYGITLYNVGDLATIAADPAAVPVSELEWAIEDSQIYNACSATPQGVGKGKSWRPLDPAKDDVDGQLVTDEPSRAAYGLQSLTFDNLQTIEDIATGDGSLAATKKFATYYVANYKDPHVRISRIVFKSRRPGADHSSPLWQFLNNVEISDLLTVKTAHGGGGGFLREFFVEGLHYTCRPGAPNVPVVELSLDVSPREHWSDGSMFEDDA